jgi:hypothetical protein
MKHFLSLYLFSSILGILAAIMPAQAQDTTWVQTFTFDDFTKRRDTYLFPDGQQPYRKILMYYTLKCDPATTQDSYNCGEWDYLTYNLIYDHRGVLDSTHQTHPNYKVAGATPDSLSYVWSPTYTYYQSTQQSIEHLDTVSFNTAYVGLNNTTSAHPFYSAETAGKAQYLWRVDELLAAGLVAGDISGMQFDLSELGSELKNLRIKLKNSALDSLTANSHESDLSTVYYKNTLFGGLGMQSLQFTTPFTWNGTSNIVAEISFDAAAGGTNNMVRAGNMTWSSGIYSAGTDFCINLNPNGGNDHVNLGSTAQITSNGARTYEAWGYARAFNNGGLFQAGPGNNTGADFSLRTNTTVNSWRGQFWGTPDFDATLSNSQNNWHHYAVTYNGSTIRLYYDGVQAAQKTYGLQTPEYDIRIGEWLGSFFNGMADEFRVWDIALTATQIRDWKDKAIDSSHPQYSHLLANYSFNEGIGVTTADSSPMGQPNGLLKNSAWWKRFYGNDLFRNFVATQVRPNVVFEQGVYNSVVSDIIATDSTMNAPMQVILYENEGASGQIADDSPVLPSIATDTLLVWAANRYVYTYAPNGTKADSLWVNDDATIYKQTHEWYSPTSVYEIGRFITPYGIGLDLGDEGFRWVYDVTDYAALLVDSVDLAAGNQQELIDLKFAFIHGTPPARVARIQQIWDKSAASYSYANLDNDVVLSPNTLNILPNTDKVKVKTRITGHGHNSNTGNYPHCCEWRDNTHYLKVNGTTAHSWKIWQDTECADNPVFPQGGTWLGSREGWCPGDVVKENDFFVTSGVQNGQITLDYDITPVPSSNQGMGGGNYVMAMHLVEYEAPNYEIDAEIYDIVRPNNWEYYSRKNPICFDPIVTVRNNGSQNINAITFSYQVAGGTPETYTWAGSLSFGQKADVVLPISGADFWLSSATDHQFIAQITAVNDGTDLYADNNTATSSFVMPDIYNEHFKVSLKTNSLSEENSYTIKDINGDIIFSHDGFSDNTTYSDTLLLDPGCYTLEFYDTGLDGLYYWAYTAQGSGYLRLRSISSNTLLKQFEPEFGRYIHYSFVISDDVVSVQNPNVHVGVAVYPNPNKGIFEVDITGIGEPYEVFIYNVLGQTIAQARGRGDESYNFDLSQHPTGVYTVKVQTAEKTLTNKIVKK